MFKNLKRLIIILMFNIIIRFTSLTQVKVSIDTSSNPGPFVTNCDTSSKLFNSFGPCLLVYKMGVRIFTS